MTQPRTQTERKLAARAAGVRRVTVLHGGGPSPLEDAVRADDRVDWTVLMPVEFMADALEWADGIVGADEVREPFVSRLSAMVHEGDIGAVAALALTEEGHAGQEYGNTPEVGSTVVDTVEKVTGHPARTFGQWAARHADAFTTRAS